MKFGLQSVFLVYLGQYKSKSLIQGHFKKLEIKSFNLAPRLMGFYSLLMKILASKKTDEVCSGSLYIFRQVNTHFHTCINTILYCLKGIKKIIGKPQLLFEQTVL